MELPIPEYEILEEEIDDEEDNGKNVNQGVHATNDNSAALRSVNAIPRCKLQMSPKATKSPTLELK
jgi:hypothetical protein